MMQLLSKMRNKVLLLVAAIYSVRGVPLDCPPCDYVPIDCEVSLPPDNKADPCACPVCLSSTSAAVSKAGVCEIKGQVYIECGSACPSTCGVPDSAEFCTDVCVKGCQCPSGTVLDEQVYECVETKQCTCPPDCSMDYCTRPGNEKALCNIPCTCAEGAAVHGCTGQCQLTHCSACYFDKETRPLPSFCDDCGSPVSSPTCLRRWANCIGSMDEHHYGKPNSSQIVPENFKCYKYPCNSTMQRT